MQQASIVPRPTEPKLDAMLLYFSDRVGQTVSREALLTAVWGKYGSEEALNQSISKLRKHFRQHGLDDVIETLPREGYRLTQVITLVSAVEDKGGRAAQDSEQRVSHVPQHAFADAGLRRENKWLKQLLAIASVLLLLSVAYIVYHSTQHVKVIKTRSSETVER